LSVKQAGIGLLLSVEPRNDIGSASDNRPTHEVSPRPNSGEIAAKNTDNFLAQRKWSADYSSVVEVVVAPWRKVYFAARYGYLFQKTFV
jgi:hypothetical protein